MQNWLPKTLLVNLKVEFPLEEHKSKLFKELCAQVQKEFEHKFPDDSAELTWLEQNITVKGQFHFIHYVPILIMQMQKQIQHLVKSALKYGFIVARSFQIDQKKIKKEGGNSLC